MKIGAQTANSRICSTSTSAVAAWLRARAPASDYLISYRGPRIYRISILSSVNTGIITLIVVLVPKIVDGRCDR